MSEAKEEASVGSKIASALGWVITAIACIAAGWIGRELVPQDKKVPPPQVMPPATVAVTNVEMRVYNPLERFVAHAEAAKELDLLPQVDGFIRELKFAEGDLVKEGQVLYVIDDTRYSAIVKQREADLVAAIAAEESATTNYLRNVRIMQEGVKGSISEQQLTDSKSAAESATARRELAEQSLKEAQYYLAHTVITAPFDGKIGKSNAYKGDYVAPSKGALAHLVQLDPIRVSFALPDRDYFAWQEAVKRGENVDRRTRLRLPDGTMYEGEGTFDFDAPTINSATAAITMRLKFPNAGGLLRPGTYLTLLADYREPPRYPSVPQTAVFDIAGGSQAVWVVDGEGAVHARIVKPLPAFEGWVPIAEGLEAGEKIVISGTSKLTEGAKTAVVAPTPNAENEAGHKTYDERIAEESAK